MKASWSHSLVIDKKGIKTIEQISWYGVIFRIGQVRCAEQTHYLEDLKT